MTTIAIALAGILTGLAVCVGLLNRRLPRFWIDRAALGLLGAMALLSALAADVVHQALQTTVFLVVIGVGAATLSFVMRSPTNRNTNRLAPWYFFAALVLLNAVFGAYGLSGRIRPELAYFPFLIVGLGLPIAEITGQAWKRCSNSRRPIQNNFAVTTAFFVVAFLCLVWGDFGMRGLSIPLVALVFIALFLALLNNISINGLAWALVPIAAAYWLGLPLVWREINLFWPVCLAVLAAVAYRRGWLSAMGGLATLLLGWMLVVNDQPRWVLSALLFFALGTAASNLPGRNPWTGQSRRTATQVFSNGGVPIVFIAAYHFSGEPAFLIGGLCGLGSALSDTLSSEIGVRRASHAWSILGWKAVPAGQSGGVSAAGLFAGMIGALAMGIFSAAMFDTFDVTAAILIAGVGFVGNITDSLLGDSIQAKYLGASKFLQDVPTATEEKHIYGWKWVDNNAVNLLSSAAASVIGAGLWLVWQPT